MAKLVLADLDNLQNEPTAVGTINSNSALIEVALENTLSRDGTSPNTMGATLDMNTNRIINLPAPVANNEPLRKQELLDFVGGSVNLYYYPIGGTTNQSLIKNSNTNYDVKWGNPPASSLSNGTTGSGTVVLSTSPTITTPTITSPTLTSTVTITPTGTDGIIQVNSAATDLNMFVRSKGTGSVILANQNAISVLAYAPPSTVNYVQLEGSITNNPVRLLAQGSDANISISLVPKGNALVTMPTGFSTTWFGSPIIYGGTATTSVLSLVSTSAAGTSASTVDIKVGTNGSYTAASFKTADSVLNGTIISRIGGGYAVEDRNTGGTGYQGRAYLYRNNNDFFFYNYAPTGLDGVTGDMVKWNGTSWAQTILSTTASTSTTSGSLVTNGGVGVSGDVNVGGYIKTNSGLGFPTGVGAGGTVTQSTNKTTAVTINKPTGEIITHNQSLGAGAITAFLVNNSFCTGQDIVLMSVHNAPTMGAYSVNVNAGGGSFSVYLRNNTGGALSENVTLRYTIIKSAQN